MRRILRLIVRCLERRYPSTNTVSRGGWRSNSYAYKPTDDVQNRLYDDTQY